MEKGRVINSVEGVVSVGIPSGSAAQLAMLRDELDAMHWRPRTYLEHTQLSQLARTLRWHAQNNPHFSRRLEDAGLNPGDGITMEWLRRLPVLTRRAWQGLGDGMFNQRIPASHGEHRQLTTSGSTGEPVRVRRTSLNGTMWAVHTLLDHLWNDRDTRGRLLSARGDLHERIEGASWGVPVSMIERTGNSLGLPITTDVTRLVAEIDAFEPNVLLTYPSMLRACLDHWQRRGRIPTSIEHVKTIGETVTDDLRHLTETVLHLRIEDTYSSNECGTISLGCTHGSQHVMMESVMVEVLDDDGEPCDPGEIGRVVLTDLLNFATPIVRYDIGDWAEQGGRCSCGRTGHTLRRIMGRTRNLVAKPDGSRHWPLTGFAGFTDIAPIRQYQIVQHALDDVELRISADADPDEGQRAALIALVSKWLGHDFPIRISYQDSPLPMARNGKHEEFVCKVV